MATAYKTVLFCGSLLHFTAIGYAEFRYEYINTNLSWRDAKSECQTMRGRLAIISDLNKCGEVEKAIPTLRSEHKIWIGGRVVDGGWKWYRSFEDIESVVPYHAGLGYKGCYHPTYIVGGIRMSDVSAEKCFNYCARKGAVGLYSTMCLCEKHLHKLTILPRERCDMTCTGDTSQKCGGLRGVSIYQENAHWATVTYNSLGQCAYTGQGLRGRGQLYYPAECDTRLRYICQFRNDEVCGSTDICFRPSIYPATWDGAMAGCRKLGGGLASVDISQKITNNTWNLPTGKFWIALRREISWIWIDGSRIAPSQFQFGQFENESTSDLCTVIVKRGDRYRLLTDRCDDQHSFLCQYGTGLKSDESSIKLISSMIEKEVMMNNRTRSEATTPSGDLNPKSNTLQSSKCVVLFLGIGVVSGVAFVFAVCVIVFLARRCSKRKKYSKDTSRKETQRDNAVVLTTSGRDVLYDVPNELQNESPFRRTQRALREGLWQSGSDGYRSNSWKRVQNGSQREGRKLERPAMGCEIRNIYPSQERSYKDTSRAIHKVQAQYHGRPKEQRREIDIEYTGNIDTRLRTPKVPETEVTLAETYSLPPHSRRTSDNESLLHVDTDLYSCVQRAMTRLSEDRLDQLDSKEDFSVC